MVQPAASGTYNQTSVAAGTTYADPSADLLASDLDPNHERSRFLVSVQVESAATLSLYEDGVALDLQDGVDLPAGQLKELSFDVRGGRSYNFRFSSGTTIDRFDVQEVIGWRDPGPSSTVDVRTGGGTISVTPTVTAGAYSANDQVGGMLTFEGAARRPGRGGIIHGVDLVDDAGQDADTEVWLFSAPPNDAGDNAAFAPSEADLENWVGVWDSSDSTWRAAGTPSVVEIDHQKRYDCAAGDRNLYGLMVTRGTPTYAATDDVTVHLRLLQD